jgi:hypothetical protein
MDQGRRERRQVDKAFMQELPGQSGTTSAFRVSVQSWELPQMGQLFFTQNLWKDLRKQQ